MRTPMQRKMPLKWRIGGARVGEVAFPTRFVHADAEENATKVAHRRRASRGSSLPYSICTRRCRGKMPLKWRIGGRVTRVGKINLLYSILDSILSIKTRRQNDE